MIFFIAAAAAAAGGSGDGACLMIAFNQRQTRAKRRPARLESA